MNRQDRLQRGYIELVKVLPWFHDRLASLDLEESEDMLRKVCPVISVKFLSHFRCSSSEAQTRLVVTIQQLSRSLWAPGSILNVIRLCSSGQTISMVEVL